MVMCQFGVCELACLMLEIQQKMKKVHFFEKFLQKSLEVIKKCLPLQSQTKRTLVQK